MSGATYFFSLLCPFFFETVSDLSAGALLRPADDHRLHGGTNARPVVHRRFARASPRACRAPRDGALGKAEEGRGGAMDSGPAIFTGLVFGLFGTVLLTWTALRVRRGEPVALGVNRIASAALPAVVAAAALAVAVWCATRL
ncbi:hypothetical protein GCM10020256_33380 [Streptomyces thermocoprophilus]